MQIKITNSNNLISFMKKLGAIEKSVLLEIDQNNTFCKIHTPDKTIMKFSSILNNDYFEGEIDWENEIKSDRIKIGIIDGSKLLNAFKYFRTEDDIYMKIKLINSRNGDCVASELNLFSTTLNIKITCADLSLLSYVEDNVLNLVHSKEGYLHKFNLYQSDFLSLSALCNLENNSNELLIWDIQKNCVITRGNSFEFKLSTGEEEIEMAKKTHEIAMYKNQLSSIDLESSECYVHENRIVFFSNDTTTSCAIGLVSK